MIKPTISYIQLISILFTVLVINPVKAVEPPPPSSQQLPSRSGVADSLNQRLPRLKPTTEKMYKLTLLEYPEKINFPADNIFLRWLDLIKFYNQNILLMEGMPLNATTLEISTNEPIQSRLLKERWNLAINIYRITGLQIKAGVLGNDNLDALKEIQTNAVQVILAEADLASTKENKIAAYKTCLSFTSEWLKYVGLLEGAGLAGQSYLLRPTYWKKYCESRIMEEER